VIKLSYNRAAIALIAISANLFVGSLSYGQHANDLSLRCAGTSQQGKKSTRYEKTIFLNLNRKTYCFDECRFVHKILNIDQDTIDLTWTSPKDPDNFSLADGRRDMIFHRKNGVLVSNEIWSAVTVNRYAVRAKCSSSPLLLHPIIEFLAHAPNQ
jgi:hypothetical protein